MEHTITIAIDGPVAAGKGTIAQKIAREIKGININSGGVYRAFALKCLREKVNIDEASQVEKTIKATHVTIKPQENDFSKYAVLLDGQDVTGEIIKPEVSNITSRCGRHDIFVNHMSRVLAEIVNELKKYRMPIIMEGRNIGTEVMPDADVKIFLTADLDVRVRRRISQYKLNGVEKTYNEVYEETKQRDEQDRQRNAAPLPTDPKQFGYEVIDDTNETEKQTLRDIMQVLQDRKLS